jgi:hypothetical protein
VLVVLSRPRSLLEFIALLAAGFGTVGLFTPEVEIGWALLKAFALGVAVAFGLLSVRGRLSVLARSTLSLGVTILALAGWCQYRGIAWSQIQGSFDTVMGTAYRDLPQLSSHPRTQQQIRDLIAPALESVGTIARVIPGTVVLVAFMGLALAGLWQHRIARTPIGAPPVPFRAFRFNDHLVWGAIFTLILMLLPLPPDGRTVAANLLVVWAGLYAARGLAVISALLASAPVLFKLLVVVLAVVVNPLALGGCLAIGLADTWLDIRGRLLAQTPEGVS